MTRRTRRSLERGSALMTTMILIAILLSGGAMLVRLGVQSTRQVDLTVTSKSSLHCAEAGIAAARTVVANNYALWNASLCNGCAQDNPASEPAWLAAIDNDLNGDGARDFVITLVDNDDDTPLDPLLDNDLQVFIVATCIQSGDARKQVQELVRFNGAGNCYQSQLGGCGGNSNAN